MKHYHDPQYQDAPDMRMLGQRKRVAMQVHTCCLCKRPIAIGTRYIRYAYMYEGKFCYDKVHVLCDHGESHD